MFLTDSDRCEQNHVLLINKNMITLESLEFKIIFYYEI